MEGGAFMFRLQYFQNLLAKSVDKGWAGLL
jgi:hypothetical protein